MKNGRAKQNKSCRRSRWGHLRDLYWWCPSGLDWFVGDSDYHVQEDSLQVPNRPFHPAKVGRLQPPRRSWERKLPGIERMSFSGIVRVADRVLLRTVWFDEEAGKFWSGNRLERQCLSRLNCRLKPPVIDFKGKFSNTVRPHNRDGFTRRLEGNRTTQGFVMRSRYKHQLPVALV